MRGNERKTMKQISGADLMAIRSQAAQADDYATLCRNNADRLTSAYLALQVENVRLLDLARNAYDCWDSDKDAKVGKLLLAMLDEKFRAQYRPDLTHNAPATPALSSPRTLATSCAVAQGTKHCCKPLVCRRHLSGQDAFLCGPGCSRVHCPK